MPASPMDIAAALAQLKTFKIKEKEGGTLTGDEVALFSALLLIDQLQDKVDELGENGRRSWSHARAGHTLACGPFLTRCPRTPVHRARGARERGTCDSLCGGGSSQRKQGIGAQGARRGFLWLVTPCLPLAVASAGSLRQTVSPGPAPRPQPSRYRTVAYVGLCLAQIVQLRHSVHEKDAYAESLVKGVREQNRLSRNLEEKVANLNQQLAEKDDHAVELVQGIRSGRQQRDRMKSQVVLWRPTGSWNSMRACPPSCPCRLPLPLLPRFALEAPLASRGDCPSLSAFSLCTNRSTTPN